MFKGLLLSAALLLGSGYGWMVQDAAPSTLPPDTKNPVKSSPEVMAKAKKVYGYECEMCHGATGDGKTDLAKDMKMTLTDLTDPKTLTGKTDAQLFDLIKNGKGTMAAEGNRMKTDDIWAVVLYIRAMAKPAA